MVAEAKLTKLLEAMKKVQSLEQLWLTISLSENNTFDSVFAACERWDSSMKSLGKEKIEVHYNDGSEEKPKKIVCSYPKCGKTGHTLRLNVSRKRGTRMQVSFRVSHTPIQLSDTQLYRKLKRLTIP